MKRILVIGNYSGRNAGDAAILGGLFNDVYSHYRDIIFVVPTINPRFILNTYRDFPVQPVSLMPWNFSLKIFGFPILRSVLNADLILITDAILFDRKLWNPIVNYLFTISLVLPLSRKRNIPTVLYNISLGPIQTERGSKCLQTVLDCADIVILRDRVSMHVLDKWKLHYPQLKFAADSAFNVIPLNPFKKPKTINSIEEHDTYISWNVTSYIDIWLKGGRNRMDVNRFIIIMSEAIRKTIDQLNVKILMVITQIMDINIAKKVVHETNRPKMITLVSNRTFSYREIAGFLSKAQIHVGMRTHSLILAAAAGTPTIAILTYPKNRGFMESIKQQDRMVEFSDFTADRLFNLVKETWNNRKQVRSELGPTVDLQKIKARSSARELKMFMN